jgi:hypothetical protein
MKNNRFAALLMALLFVSVGCSAIFSFLYVRATSQNQSLQLQRIGVGLQLNRFQSFINETIEYSKRNQDIVPLLQSFERKSDATAAPVLPKPVK